MFALAAPPVSSPPNAGPSDCGLSSSPGATHWAALQVFIHGVRKALRGGERAGACRAGGLPGYRLAITPDQTDVGRFANLQRRAREPAPARGPPRWLRRRWRRRSACGVDPALAQPRTFAVRRNGGGSPRRAAATGAGGTSYDLRLALGPARGPGAELDRASSSIRGASGFGGAHDRVYRCDRQGDALATYARARERLADELGIDPGQALQQLELAILRQDPALAAPRLDARPVARSRRRRTPRPCDRDAAGGRPTESGSAAADVHPDLRSSDLVTQDQRSADGPKVRSLTLTGPGGSGKSRLAACGGGCVRRLRGPGRDLTATDAPTRLSSLRELTLAVTGADDEAALAG